MDKTNLQLNLILEKICKIEKRLSSLESSINYKFKIIEKDCANMSSHINFIEGVYKIIKSPLEFITNKFSNKPKPLPPAPHSDNKTLLKEFPPLDSNTRPRIRENPSLRRPNTNPRGKAPREHESEGRSPSGARSAQVLKCSSLARLGAQTLSLDRLNTNSCSSGLKAISVSPWDNERYPGIMY